MATKAFFINQHHNTFPAPSLKASFQDTAAAQGSTTANTKTPIRKQQSNQFNSIRSKFKSLIVLIFMIKTFKNFILLTILPRILRHDSWSAPAPAAPVQHRPSLGSPPEGAQCTPALVVDRSLVVVVGKLLISITNRILRRLPIMIYI